MKTIPSTLRLAGLALLAVACDATVAQPGPSETAVTPASSEASGEPAELDFDAAVAKSAQTGVPVLIDFHAEWCAPCKKMDAETFPDPRVKAALEDWIFIDVDVDEEPDLARRFMIRSIPTMVAVDGEGKELGRFGGFQPPARFLEKLGKLKRPASGS